MHGGGQKCMVGNCGLSKQVAGRLNTRLGGRVGIKMCSWGSKHVAEGGVGVKMHSWGLACVH
jgi:hypothetical protein